MDVKLYLALAGSLGISYTLYHIWNKPGNITCSLDETRKICREIKHQMFIVCITYSKAMKKIRQDNADKLKGKEDLLNNFRNQLSQIYVNKENIILKKFAVSRQIYGKSLQRWKKDKQILKNTEQILDMMQRALKGLTPDFTVPRMANQKFNRDKLCQIYKQMVTLIGKKVTRKLQQQVQKNKSFDPNNDEDFRIAIRSLAIYDLKVSFLKEKGFKDDWGCPNEIFFKCLEREKDLDQNYEKTIIAYEKCYEKVLQIASANPKNIDDHQIDQMFRKAAASKLASIPNAPHASQVPNVLHHVPQVLQIQKQIFQPVKSAGFPTNIVKKQIPVDEDAELEALMMQELMSRSQQPARSMPNTSELSDLLGSIKLGMTESEIQNDWEKHAELNLKTDKMEEATEEIIIGIKDQKLIKKQIQIVEQALKEEEKLVELGFSISNFQNSSFSTQEVTNPETKPNTVSQETHIQVPVASQNAVEKSFNEKSQIQISGVHQEIEKEVVVQVPAVHQEVENVHQGFKKKDVFQTSAVHQEIKKQVAIEEPQIQAPAHSQQVKSKQAVKQEVAGESIEAVVESNVFDQTVKTQDIPKQVEVDQK